MLTEHLIRQLQGADFEIDPEPEPKLSYRWIIIWALGIGGLGIAYCLYRAVEAVFGA